MEKELACTSRALHEAWKEYPSIIPHHLVSKLDPKVPFPLFFPRALSGSHREGRWWWGV
jgi:hypothetical protein